MHSEPDRAFGGRFYDGESAAAHEADVRCTPTSLVIAKGGDVLAAWSYDGLLSHDPLKAGRAARLTHSSAPYARLMVDEPAFAETIVERAPQLSARAHRLRGLKLVLACMLVAGIFIGAGYLFLTFAPAAFARMMPDAWRDNLGSQVKLLLVRQAEQCTGADAISALAAMRAKLTSRESDPEQFKVLVYDLSIVNAFALPGGTIVISGKLIDAAGGPDGVAGVLAHEMGHVIERDSEAQLVRSLGIQLLQQVLFGGSSFGESVGGLAGLLALMSYSRDAERSADAHAARIMEANGIDPKGLISFFGYIKDRYGGGSDDGKKAEPFSLFSTHPGLNERIETLKALDEWPSASVLTERQWTALKNICSAGTSERSSEDAAPMDE